MNTEIHTVGTATPRHVKKTKNKTKQKTERRWSFGADEELKTSCTQRNPVSQMTNNPQARGRLS